MPRNIEVKARIESIEDIRPVVEGLATDGPTEIVQADTFFTCGRGMLKLRKFSEDRGVLIHYDREVKHGPKLSSYLISETTEPDVLAGVLERACGIVGQVNKVRTLYMHGRTRIHLDRVQDLGQFLELEVVLGDGDSTEDGEREAGRLMQRLGLSDPDLVPNAYIDLLLQVT